MKQMTFSLAALALAGILCSCSTVASQSPAETAFAEVALKTHRAVTPEIQTAEWTKDWWMPRHESIKERVARGNVDMILIGDSITHRWERGGKALWEKYYVPRNAVNMGFRGDRTEHVLWRLKNGELDGISPKLAMIMIGTNNCSKDEYTAEDMADGIIAICGEIRKQLPETKILLLAIFPREEKPCPLREKNALASKRASRIADGKMIHYLDINEKFLTGNGTLSKEIMPDLIHPNMKGYKIWAEAVEPKVAELMGE